LYVLYLQHNQLTGDIPAQLSNADNKWLNTINLSNNQLSGKIPAAVGNFLHLQNLYITNNQLTGKIPSELGRLSYLRALKLDSNLLTGEIPLKLGNLTFLNILDLSFNELRNTIPAEFGNLKNLQELNLAHNYLKGSIPATFSGLSHLTTLNLTANRLLDTVPSFLANLPGLQRIYLRQNHFTFDGLEQLAQHNFSIFEYDPQLKVYMNKTKDRLSVYAGGTLSNNTYKWFKDGVLTATIVGDSTYTPTSSGAYTVQVTNSIATKLTLFSNTVVFNALTALQQNNIASIPTSVNNNFSIYPNPAKTNTSITFNAAGNCSIKITDISGRVIQTKTITAVKGRNTLQLNISKYAAGAYFVTLSNEKNETQTLRFGKE
jgi:hypothetical protein